jgi:two-component system LytT family response regulator
MRVALIDDEPLARQAMRQSLAAHPELQIVGEAGTISKARTMISELRPDAIFLDIQMPGATGFDLLRGLEHRPQVVFVTAHAQHAVQAFEVEAVDYLLKPVRPERLTQAIERLRIQRGENVAGGKPGQDQRKGPQTVEKGDQSGPKYLPGDRVCFRAPERTIVAALDRIVALEAEGDFVRIWVDGEKPLLVGQTLASYAATLPQPPFASLSRSLLINAARIQRVEHPDRNRTLFWLEGIGDSFCVGRAASRRLKRIVEGAR